MLDVTYLLTALERVVVEIEPVFVRLDHVVTVAFHGVFHVILGVVEVVLWSNRHALREAAAHVYRPDLAKDVAAGDLHACDDLLALRDVRLKVLHGLVPSVRNEHEIPEPGMLQLFHDEFDCPAVGHVARQLLVIDGHVRGQGVHHDLHGLPERQALLVLAPADVHEVEAVCRHGGGVHRAELVPAHPSGPAPEQVHPVPLRYALCQPRDADAVEFMLRWSLDLLLPLAQLAV